ncbi:TPA: hypothetical protein IAA91_02460 [Candidatus Avacholeplasma faecigallinarum]|nr:hypothetical protein [Candidatus Avacholeplasma faecigallinarum]
MNDPLLFIDSVKDKNEASSNQEYYDSRIKSRKMVAKHRIDDIKAMLYYRIHVLAEIYTKTVTYEGVVKEVTEAGLRLQMENQEIMIKLSDIEDINILKL